MSVRKYVKEVEESLGAVGRPFRLSEAGRKIAWGKQNSMQRVHFMLSEILEIICGRARTKRLVCR
jgi:hypothetical protein